MATLKKRSINVCPLGYVLSELFHGVSSDGMRLPAAVREDGLLMTAGPIKHTFVSGKVQASLSISSLSGFKQVERHATARTDVVDLPTWSMLHATGGRFEPQRGSGQKPGVISPGKNTKAVVAREMS